MRLREIHVAGIVTMGMAISALTLMESYAAESNEDITIFINSQGGDIAAMLAIYDAMLRCGCDIVTIVYGSAMSAASFIAVAGTKGKRYTTPNAQYMFHDPSTRAELTDQGMGSMNYLEEHLAGIYASITDKTVSEWREFVDRDNYIFGDDLHALGGFVDHILDGM